MLSIDWGKLDKFYIILVLTLICMAVLVIFTFRGIFSAYITAYEVDQGSLSGSVRVDQEKLKEATNWVFNRQAVPLNNY